jgi:DNA polymerase III alpha subunit
MEKITGITKGIIVYQEQVMSVMREIGELSWENTSIIRKIMSKTSGVAEFEKFKIEFMKGALNKMDEKTANEIWKNSCTMGAWAFNLSHSVSYSVISAWTMWFKVYHPLEFYTAHLMTNSQEEKKTQIIKNARRDGIRIDDVDINKSKRTFSINGDGIRLGFEEVLGIGEKAAKELEEHQPYKGMAELLEKVNKRVVNKRVLNKLIEAGAFDTLGEAVKLFPSKVERKTKMQVVPLGQSINLERKLGVDYEKLKTYYKTKSIEEVTADTVDEHCCILGVMVKKNLKNYTEDRLSKGEKIDLKTMARPDLQECASCYLEDDTDMINIGINRFVFPKVRSEIYDEIEDGDVYLAVGKKLPNFRTLFIKDMVNVDRALRRLEAKAELSEKEKMVLTRIGKYEQTSS